MKRWLVSCLAGLALAPAACALAEHRALIVGVGEHQDATMNLPGIGLDTAMMTTAAERLPVAALARSSTKRRRWPPFGENSKSLAAVPHQEDDRALVHFSGQRGAHVQDDNGEEPEAKDDALVYGTGIDGGQLQLPERTGTAINAADSGT